MTYIGESELAEMEALLAKTTPGRWEGYQDETFGIYVDTDNRDVPYGNIADLSGELEQRHVQLLPHEEYRERHARIMANAEFIGKAHQDVPRFIAALREAYQEIENLSDALQEAYARF